MYCGRIHFVIASSVELEKTVLGETSTYIVPPFPLQLTLKRPASHAAVLPVETPVSYNRSKVDIRENLLVAVDHVW